MESKKDDAPTRWNWTEGDLFVIDPDTGKRTRLGQIPERIQKALGHVTDDECACKDGEGGKKG